ncbi:TlpA family protein disulfide reductase [Acidiphilium acidophilum]|uniref:TlpA family protein disulfide reductase n=1 Tax=Acidiphilium acidophilum TaxID=76588 RepID=UPI00386E9FE6
MRWTRRATLIGLGAAAAGAALTGSALAGVNAPLTALAPRPPAPDFTLPSVAGPTYSLKQFRGTVVLVNFWATWCPPCRAEMPSIERLHQSIKNKDLQILALDQGETQSVVFAYLGQLTPSPTFPIPHSSPHYVAGMELPNMPLLRSISVNRRIRGSSRCFGMFGINS